MCVCVCVMVQVLKHNYFMVGQNLLTTRQPSTATMHIITSPQKVLPSQHAGQHQQHHGGADDCQQTVGVLQTAGHTTAASKPLTKQLSRDLFPWLSNPEQKDTSPPPVLPQINQNQSPRQVCDSDDLSSSVCAVIHGFYKKYKYK